MSLVVLALAATALSGCDFTTEFSTTSNPVPPPGGAWSYGRSTQPGTNFTLNSTGDNADYCGIFAWKPDASTPAPAVFFNNTGADVNCGALTFPNGRAGLIPYLNGAYADVRFTGSGFGSAGQYRVVTTFQGAGTGTATTANAVIFKGAQQLFGGVLDAANPVRSFSTIVNLGPGDTLDFAVNGGADDTGAADAVLLDATVEPVFLVTTTADDGTGGIAGSLSSAINQANFGIGGPSGYDGRNSAILFAIPTSDAGYNATTGTFTIRPTSPLPALSAPGTLIDGNSQTDFTGNTNPQGLEIVIDGSAAGAGAHGLTLSANNATTTSSIPTEVKGLTITNFSGSGVAVLGATGNSVRGNSIFNNAGLGIDLGADGVTANDVGDGDSGPNALQNVPLLSAVAATGNTVQVSGALSSTPNTTFTLDFYRNTVPDASTFGEGEAYLGSATVTTDGSGTANFSPSFSTASIAGPYITATATAPDGSTSEFSNNVIFSSPPQANDDAYTVSEDSLLTISAPGVLANDTDAQGDAFTAVKVSEPANGTVTLNANGSFIYTPKANFTGTDFFAYRNSDASGAGNTATVTITVSAVNDAPVNIVPTAQSVTENSPLVFSTQNNNVIKVSDLDAGVAAVKVTLSVSSGTLTLHPASGLNFPVGDGNADTAMQFTGTLASINAALDGLRYEPPANVNGSAVLTIVTDDEGNSGGGGALSDSDSVAISINAPGGVPALALAISPNTISETAGAFAAKGVVTRNTTVTVPLTVQLSSSDSSRVQVPASVTIPVGVTSATFDIAAIDNDLLDTNPTVSLNAASGSATGAAAAVTVLDDEASDTTAPSITFISPENKTIVKQLPQIFGSVAGLGRGGQVVVVIQRFGDSTYFNGSAWSKTRTLLPANISGDSWSLAIDLLPHGDELRDDYYTLTAIALDQVRNAGTAEIAVRVDQNAPQVSFVFPTTNLTITRLPYVQGRAVDPVIGSGTQRVDLFLRRLSDGRFWNGDKWVQAAVSLDTVLSGNSWLRRGKLPAGDDLSEGQYRLLAVGVDGAGNRGFAETIITIGVPKAIRYSSGEASVARQIVRLRFDGALTPASVQSARFIVTVNGQETVVERVAYDGVGVVTLHLPDGALTAGDTVSVRWSGLKAAAGGGAADGQITLAAH